MATLIIYILGMLGVSLSLLLTYILILADVDDQPSDEEKRTAIFIVVIGLSLGYFIINTALKHICIT